jgi:tetratricopeptide (TPR) repeat protein
MPEETVATKGETAAGVDTLDETLAEKKPAAKTTTIESEKAYGGAVPEAAAAPPVDEDKAVATPSPSPYPFDYSPGPSSVDTSTGAKKQKKKTSTYWKKEEALAEPSYSASDDLSGMNALEEEAAESAVYSAPAKAESKKKGGGGWLAKYKAKKEAKKAAKAKKDGAKEVSGSGSGAAAAEAPPVAAQVTKADKAVKDPYVQARDYYQSGDYDAALKVLNAVLKNPSSTTTSMAYIHHLLGKVRNKKGEQSKALASYETIFSKYPSYAYIDQARWEAALLYIAKGDKATARKLLEKLLSSPQFKEKAQKKLDQL